jgi:hypothetical protein
MQEWAQVDDYQVKAIQFGNVTIYVRRPILSSDEYRRRERSVQSALAIYGRSIK